MIVADSNAIVDLLTADDGLRGQLEDKLRAGSPVEAPDLLTLEVLSALKGIERGGDLSRSDARAHVSAYLELPITSHLVYPYCERIAALSARHSVYDAAYVALAEALDAPLLTTDRRLARAVTTVEVVGVG